MRIDHDDDSAIAAWDAYSGAHKGYVEAHGNLDDDEPQVADDGAEDPALSVAIDRTGETTGGDQATGPKVRQSDG